MSAWIFAVRRGGRAAGMLAAFQGSAASHGGKKTGDSFRYLPDGVLRAASLLMGFERFKIFFA